MNKADALGHPRFKEWCDLQQTRAMLMGMSAGLQSGLYFKEKSVGGMPDPYDADTLETVTWDERMARFSDGYGYKKFEEWLVTTGGNDASS